MSRAIQTLLLTLGLATAGLAIEPGNSEKEVLATLGKPLMVRSTTAGAIWKYRDGTSVRIEGGVVKEVDGPGAAKDVVRTASGAVAEPAEVAPPPPPVVSPKTRPAPAPSTTAVSPGTSVSPKTANPTVKPATTTPVTKPANNVKAPADKSPIRYAAPEPPPKASAKHIAGLAFLGLALLAIGAGNIWLLIVAFKEHIGWGLACFFIPLAGLIFIVTHWADTKKILFFQLGAGVPLLVVAGLLMS